MTSPGFRPGWMPPVVPSRRNVRTPSCASSSTAIDTDGPPMPVEQTTTGASPSHPSHEVNSRLAARNRRPSPSRWRCVRRVPGRRARSRPSRPGACPRSGPRWKTPLMRRTVYPCVAVGAPIAAHSRARGRADDAVVRGAGGVELLVQIEELPPNGSSPAAGASPGGSSSRAGRARRRGRSCGPRRPRRRCRGGGRDPEVQPRLLLVRRQVADRGFASSAVIIGVPSSTQRRMTSSWSAESIPVKSLNVSVAYAFQFGCTMCRPRRSSAPSARSRSRTAR